MLVGNCVITNNATAIVGNGQPGNGIMLSRGNNTLTNNAVGNAFGGTYSAQ